MSKFERKGTKRFNIDKEIRRGAFGSNIELRK